MSSAPRFIGLGVALGLAAGVLVGVGLTGPGRAAAAAPSAGPSLPTSITETGTSVALPPVSIGASGVASSGPAIAPSGTATASLGAAMVYPYFGGSPSVAPDHTIVVTGVGQADLKADGSNQVAAQKTALAAALADAKAQADLIASDTGLTITGVLSVSASVSPSYGVMPMAANGAGMPSCVDGAPGGTGTVTPQPVCPPTSPQTNQQTLSVSVTVEYRVD